MTHPRIVHDAKEFAGDFYERDRSETFRSTWPSQDEYVRLKWPHFVAFVRTVYAELLGRPDVPEEEKGRIYEAMTDNLEGVMSDGAASPLPLFKDSQAFFGDRQENRTVKSQVGVAPMSLRRRLRTTSALFPA